MNLHAFYNNDNIGDVLYNESAEGIVGIDYGTTSNAYYLDTALVNENADRTLSKLVMK